MANNFQSGSQSNAANAIRTCEPSRRRHNLIIHMPSDILPVLQAGAAIPAVPLALTAQRTWNEQRQRALFRYYIAAGAGGIAVGVHTTQFAIRDPRIGLFQPILELAKEEMDRAPHDPPLIRIAGI